MKDLRISKGLVFILLAAFCAGAYFLSHNPSPCQGPWNSPEEMMACKFPNPPIGRWKAVYSAEFAKEHNLPPENISSDLSPGVDYMEMDVQPYGNGGTACLVNMLIKKPNDVALYGLGRKYKWESSFHEGRKLIHFLDLEDRKGDLRAILTFSRAPTDMKFVSGKGYSSGSALAFYSQKPLKGYDYISADAGCYQIISNERLFPSGFSFWVAKASVFGRHQLMSTAESRSSEMSNEDFFNAHFFIKIPSELLLSVFKDMPIGGN